jgi:TPR repeat protein
MKYLIAALTALPLMWGSAAQAQNTQVASAYKSNFKVASSAYQVGYYGVAMRRWMNLANANNGSAQYNIGLMHFYGQDVRKDPVEAYKWFSIAASNGIQKGQTALNRLANYMSSLQIRQAEKRAREWKLTAGH